MKKEIVDRALILVIIACIFVAVLCIFKEPSTYYVKHGEITQVTNHIYMEDGCSDSEVEKIQQLTGYLPQTLIDKFSSENGKVILVNEVKGKCIGSTEINNEGITIYIQSGYVFDALIHEFGHVYLHFYGLQDDFKEVFETEANSLVKAYYGDGSYYTEDEVEYFAQAFQTVICMSGYDTQEAAPKTFSYINNLMKEMIAEK